MATKKKPSSAAKPKTLESRIKSLESRVKELENNKIHLPSKQEFEKTKKTLLVWAKDNPVAAMGVAILIGLILGSLLG